MYRNAALVFLGLSVLGLFAWIFVRFTNPILGVSQDGFLLLTLVSLAFVIAISLLGIAFPPKKGA